MGPNSMADLVTSAPALRAYQGDEFEKLVIDVWRHGAVSNVPRGRRMTTTPRALRRIAFVASRQIPNSRGLTIVTSGFDLSGFDRALRDGLGGPAIGRVTSLRHTWREGAPALVGEGVLDDILRRRRRSH